MESPKLDEQHSLFTDSHWNEVKISVINHYLQPEKLNIVCDHQLIQKQNQLMEEIKEKLHRSRHKQGFGSMQILPIDSSISNISSAYNYGDDQSLIKSKFTQEFQSSLVNSALKEVRANCSQQTYQTVRTYVMNNKQKQCENLMKNLQKKNKQIQELSLIIILKQNQLFKLKEQMNPYIAKAQYFEEQKKKWKKKNDQNMEKQTRIHKAEMALIFKEKMHQQAKKRSERLREFTDSIHKQMRNIEADLLKIWNLILQTMESTNDVKCCDQMDPKGCWKKEVMKKCRQKLLQERNLLKQEEKQLQRQYQVLQNISDQCKRLVSDSQQGISSTINPSGISAISPTKKNGQQIMFKTSAMSMLQPQPRRLNI